MAIKLKQKYFKNVKYCNNHHFNSSRVRTNGRASDIRAVIRNTLVRKLLYNIRYGSECKIRHKKLSLCSCIRVSYHTFKRKSIYRYSYSSRCIKVRYVTFAQSDYSSKYSIKCLRPKENKCYDAVRVTCKLCCFLHYIRSIQFSRDCRKIHRKLRPT